MSKNEPAQEIKTVTITPPKFQMARFRLTGTAPYCQAKFSEKAKAMIAAKHEKGSTGTKERRKGARDFQADYEGAMHVSKEGWVGIPAPAFRNACISACRLVGFKMTLGKLSIFIEADGFDRDDSTPLVKIFGDPKLHMQHVRNATGVADLRARPLWEEWYADITVRWDSDMFTVEDVTNLLARVGMQVGIGEGRPDSKSSAGQGWGMFDIAAIE